LHRPIGAQGRHGSGNVAPACLLRRNRGWGPAVGDVYRRCAGRVGGCLHPAAVSLTLAQPSQPRQSWSSLANTLQRPSSASSVMPARFSGPQFCLTSRALESRHRSPGAGAQPARSPWQGPTTLSRGTLRGARRACKPPKTGGLPPTDLPSGSPPPCRPLQPATRSWAFF
jgi:hypothetical protein